MVVVVVVVLDVFKGRTRLLANPYRVPSLMRSAKSARINGRSLGCKSPNKQGQTPCDPEPYKSDEHVEKLSWA